MSRTVIFAVKSTIGLCYVEVEDDTMKDEDLVAEALSRIEDEGVDVPSRGLRFFENDDVDENEYDFVKIN